MEKLTPEQIFMIKYFWQEKGDLEKWSDFEESKAQIQEQFPGLLKAWCDYKASIDILDTICKSL